MSDESRADRLRRRRAERDQQPGSDDPGTPDESDESPSNETAESSDTSRSDEPESVKDARVGTYMYLPETQRTELNFRYKELNLAYERAFGDELEKNRHFYPLVVQAGLDALDGLDGEEIQELLMQLE